jgi:hypothetical protein
VKVDQYDRLAEACEQQTERSPCNRCCERLSPIQKVPGPRHRAIAAPDFGITRMTEIPKPSNPNLPGEFVIEAVAV